DWEGRRRCIEECGRHEEPRALCARHGFGAEEGFSIGKEVTIRLQEAWTELNVDAEAELADMVHQIGEKRIEMSLILGLLKAAVFSGKYPSEYKTVDNELLGLGIMGEEELEAMFGGEM
ncbi:hypothetical protein KXX56_004867, partial [Aspergillus fumigatus]